MRKYLFGFILIVFIFSPVVAHSRKGYSATAESINLLKKDLLRGKIEVGKTRLKDVSSRYGEAQSVTETADRITYNYGDLKIEFDKTRFWVDWAVDTFKERVYTSSVQDLRYDLDSGELVGNKITYLKIRKQYDEPTESMETFKDGESSIYYYGEIKMIFENVFTVRTFRGQNLTSNISDGVLQAGEKKENNQ